MRIIVRRPHAYELKAKDKDVPIPGIAFLDSEGNVVATDRLESAEKLVEKLGELTK